MVSGDIEKRLWAVADQLWANTGLKPSQFSTPVLGLIFLRYAEKRFAEAEDSIGPIGTGNRRKISKVDYDKEGVIFLRSEARFSHLQTLTESDDIGKAINEAMKAIEEDNPDLSAALPQTYTDLGNDVLVELLRLLAPVDLTGDAFGKVYEYFLGNFAIKEKGYSQRRACALAGIDPHVYRHRSKRPADTELRARMKELASERRRFGYRRLHFLLKREGWEVNWKKLYRLYRDEGLTVRKRGGRKRAVGTRTPMAIPQGPNQRWSLDFMSDAFEDGRRFRVLNVIDDFSRECLAAVVDTSIGGARVARELDRIAELRGYPCLVVSDNVLCREDLAA